MATTRKRKVIAKKEVTEVKTLYRKIMDNIKIIGAFSFIFAIVGFLLGVYSDVMKIDNLQEEIVRLNTKIDKLVELIITKSSDKFEKEKSKAPNFLREQ
jgi:hypothetical protein